MRNKGIVKKAAIISISAIIGISAIMSLGFFVFGWEATLIYKNQFASDYNTWTVSAQFPNIQPSEAEEEKILSSHSVSVTGDNESIYVHIIKINDTYYYLFKYTHEYPETVSLIGASYYYPEIFNLETHEKAGELIDNKPAGLFIQGSYIYYVYGKEKVIERKLSAYNCHFSGSHIARYKDFHFARLNLETMKNEKISKKEYDKKIDKWECFNDIYR